MMFNRLSKVGAMCGFVFYHVPAIACAGLIKFSRITGGAAADCRLHIVDIRF
jgi:hypothetical protein